MNFKHATLGTVDTHMHHRRTGCPVRNVGHAFVVPTVASSVDLVVHAETDGAGSRRVREIVAVPGRVEGSVVEVADLFVTRDDKLVRSDGFPPHPERFHRAGIDLVKVLGVRTQRSA